MTDISFSPYGYVLESLNDNSGVGSLPGYRFFNDRNDDFLDELDKYAKDLYAYLKRFYKDVTITPKNPRFESDEYLVYYIITIGRNKVLIDIVVKYEPENVQDYEDNYIYHNANTFLIARSRDMKPVSMGKHSMGHKQIKDLDDLSDYIQNALV